MKREQILDIIELLSHSQGMYGRMLEAINEMNDDEKNEFFTILEKQNFKNPSDLIIYLEDGELENYNAWNQ